jgi:hypothetical protein
MTKCPKGDVFIEKRNENILANGEFQKQLICKMDS